LRARPSPPGFLAVASVAEGSIEFESAGIASTKPPVTGVAAGVVKVYERFGTFEAFDAGTLARECR
jgi:hypothetical protein